jgi:RNA ligase (TIGR02306 family)
MMSVNAESNLTHGRALATVETIASLAPIEGADRIELARVRGWDVVVGKGDFAPGDRCVYIEIDSLLDTAKPVFAGLARRGERTDATGRRGHVLKTARLRGVYSQGIAYPLTAFDQADFPGLPDLDAAPIGTDLTQALGIVVWEPPMSVSMAGELVPFPRLVGKTDEERIQIISDVLAMVDPDWIATEKLDGASTTFALYEAGVTVASHNCAIPPNPSSALWQVAEKYGAEDEPRGWREAADLAQVAIQGETCGEKIQANSLKVKDLRWAASSNTTAETAPASRPML